MKIKRWLFLTSVIGSSVYHYNNPGAIQQTLNKIQGQAPIAVESTAHTSGGEVESAQRWPAAGETANNTAPAATSGNPGWGCACETKDCASEFEHPNMTKAITAMRAKCGQSCVPNCSAKNARIPAAEPTTAGAATVHPADTAVQ